MTLMWSLWITLPEGPIFREIKYKTAFFHTSDFLYELWYLLHCKHFVEVFSPIIVIFTSANIISFVLMKKKKLKMWAAIFCISYVQILRKEPLNKIMGTVGSISDWVSENFHFVTTWGFSRKNGSNCDY